MTHLNTNVGINERLLSLLGGGFLLYDAIAKQKINLLQTIAGTYLLLRGTTGFCMIYEQLGKTEVDFRAPNVNIRTILSVNRPRHEVYAFWRRLENLPVFMKHLKRVEVLNERESEWTAVLPGHAGTVSWKSEIVKDDPGAVLSWHSLPGSTIENAGKIRFKDAGKLGTEVHVVFSYHAPLGVIGEKTGRLLNPVFRKMVKEDIRNFKLYMETGATAVLEGPIKDS